MTYKYRKIFACLFIFKMKLVALLTLILLAKAEDSVKRIEDEATYISHHSTGETAERAGTILSYLDALRGQIIKCQIDGAELNEYRRYSNDSGFPETIPISIELEVKFK
jgi:hypothetical protein